MGTETTPPAPATPKLLDQVRDKIRVKKNSVSKIRCQVLHCNIIIFSQDPQRIME